MPDVIPMLFHLLTTQAARPASYQPPVRLYEQHHHGHNPRLPMSSAMYPTPPLPATPPTVVRVPIVEQYTGSNQAVAGVQPAPNLQVNMKVTG